MGWIYWVLFLGFCPNLWAAQPANCRVQDSRDLWVATARPDEKPVAVKADRVLVFKDRRELFLLKANKTIAIYTISLGFDPIGHKQKQGDGRTPEGRYFISFRNPSSQYHLGLKISYPDAEDLKWAQQQGLNPGGDIYLHGFPVEPVEKAEVELLHGKKDWTYGCIAVTDFEMEEIWNSVDLGTPIDICPAPQ